MSSEEKIKIEGKVKELLSNGLYKVEIGEDMNIVGHLSGRMRMNNIKILQGDSVSLEMSPYDMTKGRITFRKK
jgi:translation initiation factor IF-1